MGAKLLTREQSPVGLQRIALTIQSAAERGAEMIKQLLSFAGGGERRHEAVQLPKVIGEVENILEHTLPKSMEVHVRAASDLWPVMGDSTELCQLLLNLCINARDAMPDGGRLTITAENTLVDEAQTRAIPDLSVGPHAVMTVADTGSGIPRQIIDRVFDPFFTTKEQGQGTGLGLATCLGIVRSHGGAINVYSEPSHGTEFTIYLPATYSEQAVIPPAPLHDVPRGQGELVLLVDDETMVLDMARATLGAQRVSCAFRGRRRRGCFAVHGKRGRNPGRDRGYDDARHGWHGNDSRTPRYPAGRSRHHQQRFPWPGSRPPRRRRRNLPPESRTRMRNCSARCAN